MSPETRLEGLELFVAAAEAGSFALAAKKLGVTRSAVAKGVARLEERIGARLFQRSTRRQSLSDAGLVLHERARRALDEVRTALDEIAAGRSDPVGRLRVAAPSLLGRELVAPALAALAQRHPGLAIEVALDDRVVDLVGDGFDLAVRIGALRDSATLVARTVGEQRFVICASPAFVRAHGRPRTVADFAGLPAAVYARGGQRAPWLARAKDGATTELQVAARFACDDVHALERIARGGRMVAKLPAWLATPALAEGSLVELMADAHEDRAPVSLVWARTRHEPARLRVAIDALCTKLSRALDPPRAPPARAAQAKLSRR